MVTLTHPHLSSLQGQQGQPGARRETSGATAGVGGGGRDCVVLSGTEKKKSEARTAMHLKKRRQQPGGPACLSWETGTPGSLPSAEWACECHTRSRSRLQGGQPQPRQLPSWASERCQRTGLVVGEEQRHPYPGRNTLGRRLWLSPRSASTRPHCAGCPCPCSLHRLRPSVPGQGGAPGIESERMRGEACEVQHSFLRR